MYVREQRKVWCGAPRVWVECRCRYLGRLACSSAVSRLGRKYEGREMQETRDGGDPLPPCRCLPIVIVGCRSDLRAQREARNSLNARPLATSKGREMHSAMKPFFCSSISCCPSPFLPSIHPQRHQKGPNLASVQSTAVLQAGTGSLPLLVSGNAPLGGPPPPCA